MPNLSDNAVATWLAEREPELAASLLPPPPLPQRLAPMFTELSRALEASQAVDPHHLGRLLRSSPVRERMQHLLAHLDMPRRLRMLAWFGAPPMPEPHLVVESYLTGTPGAGGRSPDQELGVLHRNVLLLRIFRHERIASLLTGCQMAGQAEEAA